MNLTVIHLSEPSLEERIASLCRHVLKEAAGDNPIISVSQVPLDLGTNVCVGPIGRSWLNIYKQQLEGLTRATTEYVAIAEHDCLYTPEHFAFTPPTDSTFYYNENVWFLEMAKEGMVGMFSRWPARRLALSQLICRRELLIESIEERLSLINSGLRIMRKLGEPGAFSPGIVEGARRAVSGFPWEIRNLLDVHMKKFNFNTFQTKSPNLDIRHKSNFTGPRRGRHRCYSLPPWGDMESIFKRFPEC